MGLKRGGGEGRVQQKLLSEGKGQSWTAGVID
jgi:hypothetical protein